jgi:hypothetical protein
VLLNFSSFLFRVLPCSSGHKKTRRRDDRRRVGCFLAIDDLCRASPSPVRIIIVITILGVDGCNVWMNGHCDVFCIGLRSRCVRVGCQPIFFEEGVVFEVDEFIFDKGDFA